MAGQAASTEIALDDILPSPTNPRKHYDAGALEELAATIRDHGVVEPIVLRKMEKEKKGRIYELVAGERRWRAARLAGLEAIPSVVREYSDEAVLEIQLIENIHRKDLTPLEEAHGYRALIDANPDKHSAQTIATRIGQSVDYVWDILSLLKLVPEARKLLEQERIGKAHAVTISHQKPEDQRRIIEPPDDADGYGKERASGLWEPDGGIRFEEEQEAKKKDKYAGLKPKSIRELNAWIDDHIRFDVAHAAKAQPLTFETTAQEVQQAVEAPKGKVLAITFAYTLDDDAKTDDERTYSSRSWKRADGEEGSKVCDYATLGLVVAGERRGESFNVCIARDKCKVHFKRELAERQATQRAKAGGKPGKAAKLEEQRRARELREARRQAWLEERTKRVGLAIQKQVGAKLDDMKKIPPAVLTRALEQLRIPKTTEKALVRTLVAHAFKQTEFQWKWSVKQAQAWAKACGVNVKAIEKELDAAHAEAAAKAE